MARFHCPTCRRDIQRVQPPTAVTVAVPAARRCTECGDRLCVPRDE